MIERTKAMVARLLEPGVFQRVTPFVAAFDVTKGVDGAVVLLARLYVAAAAFDALAELAPPTGDVEGYMQSHSRRMARKQLRLAAIKARWAPLRHGVGPVQEVVAGAGKLVLSVLDGAL